MIKCEFHDEGLQSCHKNKNKAADVYAISSKSCAGAVITNSKLLPLATCWATTSAHFVLCSGDRACS